MLERVPLPPQIDRVIVLGGVVVGAALTPLIVALLILMIAGTITVAELVFWVAAAVIVAGALGAVLLPSIVHATFALVVTLLGVAGIFLLLGSEFLALVQVLIYGGGVTILLLFGLMLTNAADDPIVTDGTQKPFAAIVGIMIAGVIVGALLDQDWVTAQEVTTVPIRLLGERLFRDFGAPFEIASLVLIIALIGAIVIARRDREDEDGAPAEEAGREPR